jgi:hypothetical protein
MGQKTDARIFRLGLLEKIENLNILKKIMKSRLYICIRL